jgi:hypothetical protein
MFLWCISTNISLTTDMQPLECNNGQPHASIDAEAGILIIYSVHEKSASIHGVTNETTTPPNLP